jgi:hypothetical protein
MSTKPILVCMSWRGGERFARALRSIEATRHYFSRVIISVTGPINGPDMAIAREAAERDPSIEVICTGVELPTMKHQAFWITYLQTTQAKPEDWVYWLAYDDEVRKSGLNEITRDGHWQLEQGTAYFGPWAMRHESPEALWHGDPKEQLESWTSFPKAGPTQLPVAEWITQQLAQPTYMQMSGSVNQLSSFISLRDSFPKKTGPMRIEMAIAAQPHITTVAEFAEPISIIYGRSNSDRASYGRAARREDLHLISILARRSLKNPSEISSYLSAATNTVNPRRQPAAEEWRVRGLVNP